ncbi:MAG: hypothetical protein EON90_09960 [Brevundimonas sp.]|nr:MAG: hypothetical protein EON90_09960 [Brevundimonas sp.]
MTPANDTKSAYARIAALRSPATIAALDELTAYTDRNPDPRGADHAETLRRLQYAYIEAAQADGSFYLAQAEESERWAAEAEARALDYPAHADRYAREAANHRLSADRARAMLAEINAPQMKAAA